MYLNVKNTVKCQDLLAQHDNAYVRTCNSGTILTKLVDLIHS